MPKVSKVGKFRKTAAAAAASSAARETVSKSRKSEPEDDKTLEKPNETPKIPTETALSRGQRRRQAKREQYLRKEKMILSSLQLKKADEQKKRIDGLDALKAALMDTVQEKDDNKKKETNTTTPHIATNKAKQRIVASELNHMSLVLQHPAYQSNPFEALQDC